MAPGRAPVPQVGICLRFAYLHEPDAIGWTVSNAAEHDVRTRNGAVDTFAPPCNQVVGGSSPPAGSVSSQVSGWLGAADLLLRHARR